MEGKEKHNINFRKVDTLRAGHLIKRMEAGKENGNKKERVKKEERNRMKDGGRKRGRRVRKEGGRKK